MGLLKENCRSCKGIGRTLTHEEARVLAAEVPGWEIKAAAIERTFVLKNFRCALVFVNHVGAIAEAENHHPDIFLFGYKRVRLTLSTHALVGLTRNDFIVAAKINALMPSAA